MDEQTSGIRRAAASVGDWFSGSWARVLANAGIAGFVCMVMWFLVKTGHDDNREDQAIMRREAFEREERMRREAQEREERMRTDLKDYQSKQRERLKDFNKSLNEIALVLRDMSGQLSKIMVVSRNKAVPLIQPHSKLSSVIKATSKGMK